MASVEIYIKNYKGPDGTVISTETLLQTIPMTGDPVITNPKVKTDLGKAGSFEFGLELNSPYYDAMMQMKTIMRVVYFGETLFRGRVLTIDKGMARTRVVHCEGDLAFLLDSHQIGVKDDARQKTDVLTYLSSVINQHNSDVDDSDKRFILGEAPSSYSDSVLSDQRVDVPADKAEQKFGSSSYDTSMDRLEGLLSDFGGYMRTRYDPSDGTVFLDWLDNYYHPYSGQDIEVASNLIDLSGQTEVSNLFTIVLPIGKKDNGEVFINSWWPKVSPNHPKVDYIKVSELATIPLYSDEVLNSGYHRKEDYANANARFGKIWKPVEFENANTPQKLFNYAKDWIKNNFMPELTQWDVTALDLKFVGSDRRALFTGDRVKLVHPEVDQTFISVTIISAEYDLYNPDKNKFKIGIPNQQINASYGVKQKNASGAKSVNAGISTDNLQKELESKVNSLLDDLNRDRDILQQQYILKTKFGEDIGLDSPLAFLKYETDCVTERDPETVAKETADVVNKMNFTMMVSKDNLVRQALDRTASEFRFNDPIKWNDPQLVIDNTPELKQRQLTFKAQATAHLTQDLGLPDDQALVLLNESINDTNLAGLVDDDGNWTQEAIDQGALNWNPELKKVIKNAKLAFDESQGKSVAGGIITSAVPFLTGGSLDIANVLHAVESKDPTTGFTDQVVDLLNGGISGKLTELADKTGLSFDFSNILNTSEITDKVTGLTDKAVEFLNGGISGKLTELLNGTGFNFDIGNLFNTEQISNTVTGIVNKTVGLVGGLINTEEVKNTVTGIANKAVDFIGGLFSGTSKEKDGSNDVDKGINFLSGLITGSDKQTSATGSKEKALDIINGLLSGSSKEKTGSTDVDKSVDILSGLLTGSDKQTESTGTGSKVFNFLSGILTGSETGKESTGESNKLVDVMSGLFSGSKTKASSSAEEITTFFLGNDKAQVDGTTGTASFGDGYEWMVKLNDTVGQTRGFISAKDFQAVQAIPSFKTKFAAVDTFVANQATFNDTYTQKLTAAEAYINKINSTSVDADAYVSAGHGSFNSVNVKNGLTANTVTGNSVKIKVAGPNDTSEDADLSLCYSGAVGSFKDGIWTLTLYKIGGGSQDVPFDLTATDWYKNQIAEAIEFGKSQGSAEGKITGISMRTPRGSYSSTEEMFTLSLQVTGTDITNAPYDSSVKFAVSGSGLTLTKGSLINTATDAYSNIYKGRYSIKRNSGGVFKIESIDTITASVTSLPIDLELALPVKTLDSGGASNWDSEDHKYVYDLTASLSVDGTTTLKRQVKNLELVPTNAIDYGKTLVTVSSVTRTENCVYDIEQETAFDNVIVELSNGKKVVKGVDFSDVYRNAAHGISYAEEQNYTVELIDSKGNYIGEEDFLLNVEDIMYQGNRDATTISRRRYIYSSSGAMIAAYGKTSSLPSASNRIGYIYPNTLVTNLGTTTSSGIGGWVQINCEGTSCYLYTSNPDNVLHTSPDSPSNYGNLRGWYYDGQTVTYDYTGTVDTNGAATINIYASRSTTSTVLATLSNNQNISCMYLPKNYADEFMPVKIGSTEGYVESKYIVGTNAYLELHPDTPVMQSIIIDHVYQNIKLEDNSTYTKSYEVTMKTVLNNSKVVIETEPMTATAYRNVTTNIESSELSKYLSRINYFYGKMAVAGITEGTRNHKVEFTVSYSNGDSNTYIAEIEVKNDVQAETYDYYGFVYAYSGKTVNMRIEPSKSSTVVYQVPVNSRIACKYDPAEYAGVEEGDTAEWMPVQYDGYTGYMQAKYIRTTNAYEEDPGGESEDKKPSSVTIDRIIYEGTVNGSVVVKLKDTSSALPHKLTAVNKTEYMIAAKRANAEMATYFDKADDAGHYAWHSHTASSSSILAIVVCLVVRHSDGVTKDLFIKATSFPK